MPTTVESNWQMAELLSWMNPAQFFGGKDGAAVAALTVELSGAQACQNQSILVKKLYQ